MLKTDMKHFWDIKIKNVTKIHTKSVILVKHLGKNKLYFSKIKKNQKEFYKSTALSLKSHFDIILSFENYQYTRKINGKTYFSNPNQSIA